MTLVELLFCIAVLGAVIAGASLSVTSLVINTDRGRRTAEASDLLVALTEDLVSPTPTVNPPQLLSPAQPSGTYYSCGAGSYPARLNIPAGLVTNPSLWVAQITAVQCLARYGATPTFAPTTTSGGTTTTLAPQNQVQLITVNVRKTDGRASRSVTVMKRNPA